MADFPDPVHVYDCPLCDWHVRAGAEHGQWFRGTVNEHERGHAFACERPPDRDPWEGVAWG